MTAGELSADRADEIRNWIGKIPFAKLLGIEVVEIGSGYAKLSLEITEDLKRNFGIVHGGAIASLIDSATAFATLSLIEPGQRSTTIDLTIQFLRPLSSGHAVAEATVIRAGRRVLSVSANVYDEGGKLVATALSTYIKD
jgi:acyl-CoA thioesterase